MSLVRAAVPYVLILAMTWTAYLSVTGDEWKRAISVTGFTAIVIVGSYTQGRRDAQR